MARAGVTHDVVLTDGTREVPLVLTPNADRELYVRRWAPDLPLEPARFGQDSWHGGFGAYRFNPREPHRYAYSDGVDARFANGLQLAPKRETIVLPNKGTGGGSPVVLPNHDFSSTDISAWQSGASQSTGEWYIGHEDDRQDTEIFVGSVRNRVTSGSENYIQVGASTRSWQDTLFVRFRRYFVGAVSYKLGTTTQLGLTAGGTLSVTFRARYVGSSGWQSPYISSGASVRLVKRAAGSKPPSSLSTTAPAGRGISGLSWSTYTVEETFGSDGAGTDEIYLVVDSYFAQGYGGAYAIQWAGRRSAQIYMDDFVMLEVSNQGSETIVDFDGTKYYGFGDTLYSIKESDPPAFNSAKTFTGETITDACEHGDKLLVVTKTSDTGGKIHYSSDPGADSPTWDTAGNSVFSGRGVPDFVESVVTLDGDSRLVIVSQPNLVYVATDSDTPSTYPTKDNALEVGPESSKVTKLHRVSKATVIGKSDGLYYAGYDYAHNEKFFPAVLALVKDDKNYIAGTEGIDNYFYFPSRSYGIERMAFGQTADRRVVIDNVNPAYSAAEYPAYGGRFYGLDTDGFHIMAIQRNGSNLNVLSGSYEATPDGKNLAWHTLMTLPYNEPFHGTFFDLDDGLYIVSGAALTMEILRLPKGERNPMSAETVKLTGSGDLVTAIFDGEPEGWRRTEKLYLDYEQAIDTSRVPDGATWSFGVEYQLDDGIDDDGGWTSLGSVTSGNLATWSFPESTVGREIRYRYAVTCSDEGGSPRPGAFEARYMPLPTRRAVWEMTAGIGDVKMLNGQYDDRSAESIITDLVAMSMGNAELTLKTSDAPDTGYQVKLAHVGEGVQFSDLNPDSVDASKQRVVRLALVEIP